MIIAARPMGRKEAAGIGEACSGKPPQGQARDWRSEELGFGVSCLVFGGGADFKSQISNLKSRMGFLDFEQSIPYKS
jgi:hypothetical protein